MVKYAVLGSGSKGNSYVVYAQDQGILIDVGFSYRSMTDRLAQAGLSSSSIKACLITHLHPDHDNGLGVFLNNNPIPYYISSQAIKLNHHTYNRLKLNTRLERKFEMPGSIDIGPFHIDTFPTSHDSLGSAGFCIGVEGHKLTIITDTGTYDQEMVDKARNSDVLFLEANHDLDMLHNGSYPPWLKARIEGQRGHLSNMQARQLLCDIDFNCSRQKLYLIHISDENNSREALNKAFCDYPGADFCFQKQTRLGTLAF